MVPAILILGLVGAGPASAAEPTASTAQTGPTAPTVSGAGTLAAHGSGHVRLGGSYVLTGSLTGGTLRIDGAGRYSTVRVTGWTSKTRQADGTIVFRFRGTTGHFRIAGRTIVTRIDSGAIRFTATGHGRAWLLGAGSYWVNGHGPKPWTATGATYAF